MSLLVGRICIHTPSMRLPRSEWPQMRAIHWWVWRALKLHFRSKWDSWFRSTNCPSSSIILCTRCTSITETSLPPADIGCDTVHNMNGTTTEDYNENADMRGVQNQPIRPPSSTRTHKETTQCRPVRFDTQFRCVMYISISHHTH